MIEDRQKLLDRSGPQLPVDRTVVLRRQRGSMAGNHAKARDNHPTVSNKDRLYMYKYGLKWMKENYSDRLI